MSGIVCAMLLPGAVSSHSLGVSLEATDGQNLIDIGYDPIELTDGTSAVFDMSLKKVDTREAVDFHHVWVRVVQERQTVLATGVARQELGPTTLVYVFPSAGAYTLEVSYRAIDGTVIASSSFPLTVESSDSRSGGFWYMLGAGLLIVIGVVALAIRVIARRAAHSSNVL